MRKIKKTVLITAGPTREYIDPVRFLSNSSSGKLGYELAKSFSSNKYNVILVSGPVCLKKPKNIKFFSVVSCRDMFNAVKKLFFRSDIFISCAAVSDYRPIKYFGHKIKKNENIFNLKLIPNIDILKYFGSKRRNGQVIVGFALETRNCIKNALEKLRKKNLDLVVLNSPETLNSDYIKPIIVDKFGKIEKYNKISKQKFAKILFNKILEYEKRY